jgi:diguanylate cyclase (GGDEF)-like protein
MRHRASAAFALPTSRSSRRLVALVAGLVLSGLLVTSLGSYLVSIRQLRANIVEGSLPLTSDNIYSEIQKDLLRPVFASRLIARNTLLRDWITEGERDDAPIARYLAALRGDERFFASFFVSERTRNYYYQKGILKRVSASDPADEWYFRVRSSVAPYEINVDRDAAADGALTVFVNYRVLDDNGGFLGVAGVGLTMSAVRQMIDSYAARFDRRIYLASPSGQIMLASAPGADREQRLLVDRPGMGRIARLVLAGQQNSFEYKTDGRTVLLNARWVPELGWYLIVEQDEAPVLAAAQRNLFMNLLLCLLVTSVITIVTSVTVERYQTRLERMAVTDKLTGLLNREGFETALGTALGEARRGRQQVALILFDIDDLKGINDKIGHLAGDTVIAGVAAAALAALGDMALLCRWGGDEFLALLTGKAAEEAVLLATEVGAQIREAGFVHQGKLLCTTVSIGIATHRPGEDVDQLLGRVDHALYDAKAKGRDRVAPALS